MTILRGPTQFLSLFLFFSLSMGAYADLVGHWQIEAASGTEAADATANVRTGTIAGGATWVTDNLPPVPAGTSAALEMDGLDDQIDIVGYKGIGGVGDRSVTAWIRTRQTTDAQNKGIVSWGANLGGEKWVFRIQNGNGTAGTIRVEVNGGYLVGNTVVTDGEWHHVAVTWADDGTPDVEDAKLYVDGVLDADFGSLTVPPSASLGKAMNTAATADVRIGDNFQTTHNWDGWIDDVRIYDEAIDAATIASLAQDTAIIASFEADLEVVASGAPVVLSWASDPTNTSLSIDNGVGDVLGTSMVTVNPTADTTYTLKGIRGATTIERSVTVLVESPPVINNFAIFGSLEILAGSSARLFWDVFADASLSLNGADVSGLAETLVSPLETTVYTLSATNTWGTTTADVTVTVLEGNPPDISWAAAGLADGDLDIWIPAINITSNMGIVFNRNTGGTVESGASNFSNISQWVNSPGYNMASNPADSFHDGLSDLATKQNVSWEMIFRPGDFSDFHVLFNTGGNGAGTALTLNGSTLDFRLQNAANADQMVTISTDLSSIGAASDFYHVVATADVESASTGTASLYVNGHLVAGPITSVGIINDWDGGDLAELGKGNNIPGSSASGALAFTGDIALFNYYGGRALLAAQITDLYNANAGASGSQEREITKIVYNAEEQRIELTFHSLPNRDYALWESSDLELWIEENDSILSQGAETTYFIENITLPDPALPRNFYQVRSPE